MVVPILLSVGCGGEDDVRGVPSTAVRDSAGVQIIENAAPDPETRLGWRIGPEPLLSIGELSGDPQAELFGVEDALRLADGRVLVAVGGASEIRVFDRDGVYQSTWGRGGEGPGEFTGLSNLSDWPGDSVMAWDFARNRLTVFELDGRVVRTERLTQGDGRGAGRFEGVLPDRSIVTASLLSFAPTERSSGLVRRTREFVRVAGDGRRLNDFGRHDDEEYYSRPDRPILRHPFRRSVFSAVWNGRIVITPSDRYEIRSYEPNGALHRIMRREHSVQPVTQADIDAYVRRRLEAADPDVRPLIEEVMTGLPPVESFPAFSDIRVDEVGDLWVREYAKPGEDQAIWTVFAPDGTLRGLIETPAELSIYRIGRDVLLGLSVDDLGVERVQLWSLTRTGS